MRRQLSPSFFPQNSMRKTGVIADDFTGAGDIASFLQKGGARTLLLTEIPASFREDYDCVVLALKSRSAAPEEAVRQVKRAAAFLREAGMERIYFKYCSTFDSTPEGNIGVVSDFLLEELGLSFTLLCPSLPVNGRTVKDGILYVHGVPLAESPMKDHPLNPMWASSIPKLMSSQSRYPCFVLKREDMISGMAWKIAGEYGKKYGKFYLVPDYENEEDGKRIAELFGDLGLLTGGSGLAEYLAGGNGCLGEHRQDRCRKAILLCGSCSRMSAKQIAFYRDKGYDTYGVDSGKLAEGSLGAGDVVSYVLEHENVLVYSTAAGKTAGKAAGTQEFYRQSRLMENLMADLSQMALAHGFDRIIAAGGETSGAVTLRLGYGAYEIGNSVAPGVPVMRPLENRKLALILKSGNFGEEDFFEKALQEGRICV